MERRNALTEDRLVADHALGQIQEGLLNVTSDSDKRPIQYKRLNLCGIADFLMKKLSPLQQLTKDEKSILPTKIEDEEIVPGSNQDLQFTDLPPQLIQAYI